MPGHLITAGGYILLATSIFVLAHWVQRGVKLLMTIHRAALIFLSEHDLMAEDYCIRRHIQRHNMRAMAMAAAAVQGDQPSNGEGKGRSHHV